jgi:cyclase
MAATRLIARLDVKGPNLIKGIHLEGLRVIGDPNEYAHKYYTQGADEIIYIDCVASLYGRNNLDNVVRHATQNVFVPMTVGGGFAALPMWKNCCAWGPTRSPSIQPPPSVLG